MKFTTPVAGSLIALALAGAPQAKTIQANDTDAILNIARGYGAAELVAQGNGDPQITGKIEGITYQVYFLNCTDHTQCQDLNFYLGFLDIKPSLETINAWNFTKRFSRAYLDQDQDASIEMDLDLANGVDAKMLDAQFDIWRQVIAQFATHIGYN